MGLISFLTDGKKECRAWTIRKGTKAPQAAGKIHSDFERGFIRAQVIEMCIRDRVLDSLSWVISPFNFVFSRPVAVPAVRFVRCGMPVSYTHLQKRLALQPLRRGGRNAGTVCPL